MKKKIALFLALLTVVLVACSPLPQPTSAYPEPVQSMAAAEAAPAASSALPQEESAAASKEAVLTEERLPVWETPEQGEPSKQTLPPQLLVDEPIAYRLAQSIAEITYPSDILEDFDGIENAYQPPLLQTALYRTPTICLSYERGENSNFINKEYPNHKLMALLNHELKEERWISEFAYVDDVEKTAMRLYGNRFAFYHHDVSPYYYYAQEGVYGRVGDFGGPMWRYPQILHYEKTNTGYTVDAVMIFALDEKTPLEENGVLLTPENLVEATQNCGQYRYVFCTAPDGSLTLDGYKVLRKRAGA